MTSSSSSCSEHLGDTPGRSVESADSEVTDTSEVRWFARGPVPASIFRWFTRFSTAFEIRRDRYRLDGSPDMGLKRRDQGRAEVKIRCASVGSLELDGAAAGRVEGWRKISAIDEAALPAAEPATWLDVHKIVLTRSYHVEGDGALRPVYQRDPYRVGCDVELASVTAGDLPAWTFALEAGGPAAPDREAALRSSLEWFLEKSSPPAMLSSYLTRSLGYPEWLATEVAP